MHGPIFCYAYGEESKSRNICGERLVFVNGKKIALYCGKSSLSTTPLVVLQIVNYRASPSREIGPVCVCMFVSVYVCLCIFMSGQ